MKKWCSGMSRRSGRGTNNEYFRRDSGENSRTAPFCSKTCPFHSLRKTIGVPTSHVVSRSEPYCHCLTRAGVVKACHTFFAGAEIFTVELDVFTERSPDDRCWAKGSARRRAPEYELGTLPARSAIDAYS